MGEFKGKRVMITGANGGIGRALVQVFSSEGADIIAHLRKENEDFNSFFKRESIEKNVSIRPVYFDLADDESISNELKELFLEDDRIDVLINNAGMVGENRLFQMTRISEMKEVFDVNFFSAMRITQIVSRLMIRKKRGNIVNISSVAGLDGDPGQLEYSCSKAAIACATKKLAIELGRYGIRVNAVAPGLTDTKMLDAMNDKTEMGVAGRSILGRRSDPKEIANVIAFLASEKSSYITGQIVRVDGGVRVV